MKAVVLEGPKKISTRNVCRPDPAQHEVLVKVKACGICGSDIRYYDGENPWSLQTLGVDQPSPPNMILGHEFSGEVVEVGKEVSATRKTERIAVLAYRACEECYYCKSGRRNLCAQVRHLGHGAGWGKREYYPGGMAEYCAVWSDKAYLLPSNISFEEATFIDGIAVAIHAVNRGKVKIGDDVLILGAGPIGLEIMQVAKAVGARKAFCVDVYNKALKIAEELGADAIIDGKSQNIVEQIMKSTRSCGVNTVFDTVGSEETFSQGIRALRRGGTLVLLAAGQIKVPLNIGALTGERTITTSVNNPYRDFATAISLLDMAKVSVKPIITHRFGLFEIKKAFKVLANKEKYEALKVIILP